MEKKGIILALCCVALMTFGCNVSAQVMSPTMLGDGYSITAGAAFSVSDNVNNDANIMIGIAWYGLLSEGGRNTNEIGLSGDWIPITTNAGNDVQLVPVMFNYRSYGITGSARIFTNFGIGILAATDDIPEMLIDEGANFGWTGGFGVDFSNEVFGQFRFIGGSNPGDDGLLTFQLGYRF